MTAGVDKVVTSGVFSLDGEDFDVDNNIWLIGDDSEVLIVDAAHDAAPIVDAVDGRTVVGIVCTHGHNDHINAVGDLRDAVMAPVYLHPGDRMLWDAVYADVGPDRELADGDVLTVAGTRLQILSTPGHSPGSCCLYAPDLGVLFAGDTLFHGGPGATGRSYSDYDTIVESIASRLLSLPADTVVHTGHGDDTTIGAEAPSLEQWRASGT
ncbi:MAG: MBL fold metallo-hydrolase [Geodermatophilaceae bacterium]|nr:MBL fold metallo-hydrolase [Geodermatophilaceae bacterium]MDQ3464779.1 MBL fold metallo-hydrolase [Actinomycetota bacterium]